MKTKRISSKLSLNKETLANLENLKQSTLNEVMAGRNPLDEPITYTSIGPDFYCYHCDIHCLDDIK